MPTTNHQLDLIHVEIERLEWALAHPNRPGMHWIKVQVIRGDVHLAEWIEVSDDFTPTPANRPVRPEPNLTRTVNRPRHDAWKKADHSNWHRTGAPWHTCPNCTTFETVAVEPHTRPYHALTGDLLTKDEADQMDPAHVEHMTDWIERRKVTYLKPNRKGEELPKPITGLNLYRSATDGHEECWDCGWKGPAKQPAAPKERPIRNGAAHTIHPKRDIKSMLAEYLRNRNNQGATE